MRRFISCRTNFFLLAGMSSKQALLLLLKLNRFFFPVIDFGSNCWLGFFWGLVCRPDKQLKLIDLRSLFRIGFFYQLNIMGSKQGYSYCSRYLFSSFLESANFYCYY